MDIVFNFHLNEDDIVKVTTTRGTNGEATISLDDGSQIIIERRTVLHLLSLFREDDHYKNWFPKA